jgi:polysaccharide deacetylase family protein (PEP-CTERM system associated)
MSVSAVSFTRQPAVNALSVDVEDYFQVRSFADRIAFSSWDSYGTRFGRNTRELLELFQRYNAKATFFVLGWNAEKDRDLVREIGKAGHEIASHGWNHTLVYQLSRSQFREEVVRTKSLLEDISGTPVVGFRAPSYSITKRSLWALEVLAEAGHLYDSSIYPIWRRVYGIPSAERNPHLTKAGSKEIVEFPMSTARIGKWNVPFGSGAYLRLMPLWITKGLIARQNSRDLPAIVSLHPWELDSDQPRVCSVLEHPNHYLGLGRTRSILEALLGVFRFDPVRNVLENLALLLA